MNLKIKIITKIVQEVAMEMEISTDEFFELIDHDMRDVLIGIKMPSTKEVVLYFLKDGDDCRFFLPHEIENL